MSDAPTAVGPGVDRRGAEGAAQVGNVARGRVHLPIAAGEALVDAPPTAPLAPRPRRAPAADLDGAPASVAALARAILAALTDPAAPPVLSVVDRAPAALDALESLLGDGEVELEVTGAARYVVAESALHGVWRVRTIGPDGADLGDHVEIGDLPRVVRAAALHGTRDELETPPDAPGLMNARALLAEIGHRAKAQPADEPNHVINLSLLPTSAADRRLLDRELGVGPVQGVVWGHGSCRVTATTRRRVWVVRYFDSMGQLVADTLEIGDVPVALAAAPEDLEDSATRLASLVEAGLP